MTAQDSDGKYTFRATYGEAAKKQSIRQAPLPQGELDRMLAEIGLGKDTN